MANKTVTDPYKGLVPLFRQEDSVYTLPLTYAPDESKGEILMGNLLTTTESHVPVTVRTMIDFRLNFNRKHASVLHRLDEVLLQEPIIIAGGAVLEALTGGDTRTSKWWTGTSDVDLFMCTQDPVETTRIAKRAFEALAVIGEKWVVMRSRGVITMHSWVGHGEIEEKIQIVPRLYASPTEVLVGFDCDCCCCCCCCCCCAFDGRGAWAAPHCLEALQKGVNVVNSIHSWPNKASHELRLAKYASRGFPVAVPSLESNRVDYDSIVRTKVCSLKGLARLLNIFVDVESSFCQRNGTPSLPIDIQALQGDIPRLVQAAWDTLRGHLVSSFLNLTPYRPSNFMGHDGEILVLPHVPQEVGRPRLHIGVFYGENNTIDIIVITTSQQNVPGNI